MSITVYAPASIGNFSVGFDLLGAAIQPIDIDKLNDSNDSEKKLRSESNLSSKSNIVNELGDRVTITESRQTEFSVSGPYAEKLPQENHGQYCLALCAAVS